MALKGSLNNIKYAKAIYLEVNEKELYKKCGLIGEIDLLLENYNFKRILTNITQHGWGRCIIYNYISLKIIFLNFDAIIENPEYEATYIFNEFVSI